MTETKKAAPQRDAVHGLSLDNRHRLGVTGVIDVAGFSEDKVEILTNMGKLLVKGKKLNVKSLNTDTGELRLTGEVKLLEYTDAPKGGGLLAGLFK